MSINPLLDQAKANMEFEESLSPGDQVIACWTWGHGYHSSPAEVVRVNRQTVRVRLTSDRTYLPEGREIVIPRYTNFRKWSENNRLCRTAA